MAARSVALSVDIADAPILGDGPALDRVEMVDRAEEAVEPAQLDKLLQRGLEIAGLVGAAALQDRRLAVPEPREAEARGADRQQRLLQRRDAPALAAIGRDVDPRHLAAAAPGEAGDLVEARAGQLHL